MGYVFDEVWFVTPCSPLLEHSDLINSAKFFDKNSFANSMLAISEYSPPIQWAFKRKNKILQPLNKKSQNTRSQDLKKMYFDTGTFGAFKGLDLKSYKKKLIGYEISRLKGIDIDTMDDWNMAEKIYKSKR